MYKLVSEAAQKQADARAVTQYGYPRELLMEQASQALARRLTTLGGSPIVVLVGPGNNGGDGWGVARVLHLARSAVTVVVWEEPRSPEAVTFAAIARAVGVGWAPWGSPGAARALSEAALWVDAVYGAGFRGPLKGEQQGPWRELLALRSATGATVVAVDVPSGLGGDGPESALRADRTLAMGWIKASCLRPGARSFCGSLEAVPLGYPDEPEAVAEGLEWSDLGSLLPRVSEHAHKGVRGRVALWGGSPGMTGALVLCARSAAAAGAGLVSLWTDREVADLVVPQVPAFQVGALAAGEEPLAARRPSAWVAGPGWGRAPSRVRALERLLADGVPTVVDADGLVAWSELFSGGRASTGSAPVVLTPHPGEMRQLLGGHEPVWERVVDWVGAQGVTLVLKDAATWILSPHRLPRVWDGPNPALGTGGSGDCLAGVVGGLLARGVPEPVAACAGELLHARAGAELASSSGWFQAEQLPDSIARWSWKTSQS